MHPLLKRAEENGTPLIEDDKATFLWSGRLAAHLVGDSNDWGNESPSLAPERIAPDLWTYSLALLQKTPERIEACTVKLSSAQLSHPARPRSWSAADIRAHLRARDEVWTHSLYAMLAEHQPRLPLLDERRWAKVTRYGTLDVRCQDHNPTDTQARSSRLGYTLEGRVITETSAFDVPPLGASRMYHKPPPGHNHEPEVTSNAPILI
jgi:hypothetical protein